LDRPVRTLFHRAYGVWCIVTFLPLAIGALLLILVVPGLGRRRRISRGAARLWFRVAGIRLRVTGAARLPDGPCVVIANHASYLDGIAMHAALPPRFTFVIKKEMVRVPLASLLLRRIGSEFVDRFNRHAGAADTRRVVRKAGSGEAIGFFPEGTFTKEPGLAKFHAGAFVTAARAGIPIVPTVIRGTRAMLPAEAALSRPGRIDIELLEPIAPPRDDQPDRVKRLLRESRAAILAKLDEPDLDPQALARAEA
jgi:1-acyl-sn-glycerol-3-phosphate acyltransferase